MKIQSTKAYTNFMRQLLMISKVFSIAITIALALGIIIGFGSMIGFLGMLGVIIGFAIILGIVQLLLELAKLRIILIENLTETQKAIERIEKKIVDKN